VEFLANVNEFICCYDIENVVVIDKTSLMTSPYHKYRKHIAIRGKNKPRRNTPSRGYAHVVYTGLKRNGEKCPFFVQTVERDLVLTGEIFPEGEGFVSYVASNAQRRGERGFLKYLEFLIEFGHLPPRSVLIFDGETSFVTPMVQNFLRENSIFYFVILPPVLHQLLSPCDNHFHSTFKLKFYSEISNLSVSALGTIAKLRIAKRCYDEVSPQSVLSMFRKCGLLGPDSGGDFRSIITHLVNEGLHYLGGRNRKVHQRNLSVYIEWCKSNNLEEAYLKRYQICSNQISDFLKKH
jgi:hypothetical protein